MWDGANSTAGLSRRTPGTPNVGGKEWEPGRCTVKEASANFRVLAETTGPLNCQIHRSLCGDFPGKGVCS